MMQQKILIIGIVGFPGAGKTTVAEYLVRCGFFHVTLSDFVREEIVRSGGNNFSRTMYQKVANRMREHYGGDVLAVRAVEKIRTNNVSFAVIDGIRNVSEIGYLRKQAGFYLLGIVAESPLRFTRLSQRTHTDKQIHRSYAEFVKEEKREDSLGSARTGLRVSDSLKKADVVIENNGNHVALYTAIDEVLVKLKKNI